MIIASCSGNTRDSPNRQNYIYDQSNAHAAIFSNPNELRSTGTRGEYRIGANDLLEITVFKVGDLSRKVRVDNAGMISMPLIGNINVMGITQKDAERKIASLMGAKYLQNPQISVFIKEHTAKKFTVGGAVNKPGVYPLNGEISFSQAIAIAEGMKPLADPKKVVLFRKYGQQIKAYNLNLAAIRTGSIADPILSNEDQIIVHESNSKRWLEQVQRMISFTPIRLF